MNENSDSSTCAIGKRKSYKLSEKASALKTMEDENLSFAEMNKISKILAKSLADWAKQSPQILQSGTISSPRLAGGGRKPPFPISPFPETASYQFC